MDKYCTPENSVEKVTSPIDANSGSIVIKIGNNTKGITDSDEWLSQKAKTINDLWDSGKKVDVEVFISGYYYNTKKEDIKLCVSAFSIHNAFTKTAASKRNVAETAPTTVTVTPVAKKSKKN